MTKSLFLIIFLFLCVRVQAQSLLESNATRSVNGKYIVTDSSFKSNLRFSYDAAISDRISQISARTLSLPAPPVAVKAKAKEKKLSDYKSDPLKKTLIDAYIRFLKESFETNKTLVLKANEELRSLGDSLIKNESILSFKMNQLVLILDSTITPEKREGLLNIIGNLSGDIALLKQGASLFQRDLQDHTREVSALSIDKFVNAVDSVLTAQTNSNALLDRYTLRQKALKIRLLNLNDSVFRDISARWNLIVKDVMPSSRSVNKQTEQPDLGALPGLSSILGQREVNFNLSVLGYYKSSNKNSSVYGEIRLFTAGIKTDSVQNIRTLFLPEASTFGVSGKINIGLGVLKVDSTSKRFGINLEFSLLGKKIKPDNSTETNTVTPLVLHTKTGFEYVAVKNILSFYANVNTITVLDQANAYKDKLKTNRLFRGFVDFGTRMLLVPADNKLLGLKLKVDFGFIANGGDVRSLIGAGDLVIPTFRIGLQKDFKL